VTGKEPWRFSQTVEEIFAAAARRRQESRELAHRNRRIIAERMGWPDGAIEVCEKLDLEFPGWHCNYWAEDVGWSKKGWYARPWGWRRGQKEKLFGDTVEELRAKLVDEARKAEP
jgi:hypothetical protein